MEETTRRIKTRAVIYVTTSFIGFHRFKDAPDEVAFLRSFHRHVFHVKAAVGVSHDDRQVEFFQLKQKLDSYLNDEWVDREFEYSCESIAMEIASFLSRWYSPEWVDVSEDLECGARVYWETY